MPIPAAIWPSTKTWLGIAREATTGTPLTPTNTIPLDKGSYSPEDTPKFLPDEAIRGSLASLYNDIIGVTDATFSFGGPAFLDVGGFWLDNAFGDLSSTSGGTLATAQPLSAGIAVGATAFSVATSLGSVVTGSVIQITDGPASEIVIATVGSTGTSILFAGNPTRFAHTTAATASLQTAATTYTHKFALINTGTGQPPTHTITDATGITASVGARAYPSACVSSVDFSGNAEQLLMQKVSGNSWLSAPAGTTPVNTTAFTIPVPNWRSTVTVGGTQIYNIGEWSAQFKRVLQIYWTAQGAQNPFIIARGGLSATYDLNFTVAIDESPLTAMLSTGPQAVQIAVTNGLSGANLLSLTINSTKAQAVKSKIDRNAVLVGYQNQLEGIANATDVGGTAGLGPATITLVNAIATY